MLGQQSLGPLGCVELIILELDDGERAVVLDEFTHERGVGIERIAADQFAVEGAHGQGVHQAERSYRPASQGGSELRQGQQHNHKVLGHQRPRKNKASRSRIDICRQVGRPWLHWSERSVSSI